MDALDGHRQPEVQPRIGKIPGITAERRDHRHFRRPDLEAEQERQKQQQQQGADDEGGTGLFHGWKGRKAIRRMGGGRLPGHCGEVGLSMAMPSRSGRSLSSRLKNKMSLVLVGPITIFRLRAAALARVSRYVR